MGKAKKHRSVKPNSQNQQGDRVPTRQPGNGTVYDRLGD